MLDDRLFLENQLVPSGSEFFFAVCPASTRFVGIQRAAFGEGPPRHEDCGLRAQPQF
jgi:hypothetical protein